MTVGQQMTVTGGTLTLSAATGITVNNASLNSTLTDNAGAVINGAVNLNGGRGVVAIYSGGTDYTIDKNVMTVTGSLFEVNLTGTNNGAALNGKLIGTNNAKINSTAVNMAFLGSATGNDIKIQNGTSVVTYVSVVTPDKTLSYNTENSVLIDKRFVLPTIALNAASTGISLIDAAGATLNQSLNLGLKYADNVAITINDDGYVAATKNAPATNYAAANITWFEGGSIKIINANTYFNKQLTLRTNGSAVKNGEQYYCCFSGYLRQYLYCWYLKYTGNSCYQCQ